MEECFPEQLSSWDEINKVMLNTARMSHRNRLVDSMEEQLKMHDVEQDMINMENNASHHEIKQVCKMITRMLNTARKKQKEWDGTCHVQTKKEKRRYMALHLKAVLRLKEE